MRVVAQLPGVNQRRYGRAWIALVTFWPIGRPPTLEFGGNVDYDTAEIAAPAGALVKYGRKDLRGGNTLNQFARVLEDGTLEDLSDRAARDYWLAQHPPAEA